MRRAPAALTGLLIVAAAASAGALAGQFADLSADLVREPAIAYFTRPAADRVARLNADLQSGAVHLRFDPSQGYLPSVLDALRMPAESQVLVFSKTSVQARFITPRNPRAIYFDDTVVLGYIHGADFLEFAAQDPQQGVVFYTLDQRSADHPAIQRRDFCLQCHNTTSTLEVPGMLVRSITTTVTGAAVPRFGNYTSDHRSPFDERWAGYYVSGRHGAMQHLGNAMLVDRSGPDTVAADTFNLDSVKGRFDAEHYLAPYSDIVALLVFEHQMHMINLLTRIGWDARLVEDHPRAGAPALLAQDARELVDYLLFVDERPLPAAVAGTSGFAEKFSAEGPTDSRGRSLRQLDLTGRLLRYPCSYMIYSDAFDALPPAARAAIYERMWHILSGKETSPRYARLSSSDRVAVVGILRETKRGLPEYFQ